MIKHFHDIWLAIIEITVTAYQCFAYFLTTYFCRHNKTAFELDACEKRPARSLRAWQWHDRHKMLRKLRSVELSKNISTRVLIMFSNIKYRVYESKWDNDDPKPCFRPGFRFIIQRCSVTWHTGVNKMIIQQLENTFGTRATVCKCVPDTLNSGHAMNNNRLQKQTTHSILWFVLFLFYFFPQGNDLSELIVNISALFKGLPFSQCYQRYDIHASLFLWIGVYIFFVNIDESHNLCTCCADRNSKWQQRGQLSRISARKGQKLRKVCSNMCKSLFDWTMSLIELKLLSPWSCVNYWVLLLRTSYISGERCHWIVFAFHFTVC